jgi:hypothetical protein
MLPPDEDAGELGGDPGQSIAGGELAGKPLERALLDCLAEQLGSSVFG